ncbi:MAG TPA: hypothetical protein PJ986_08570 [Gammaproteobacteria bacterium]|nr:hypothetical protein [Gammaproteobacteria bacterium]
MRTSIFSRTLCLLVLLGLATLSRADSGDVVVIGHPGLPKVDRAALVRLYTGRSIELAGALVTVINGAPGSAVRQHFLNTVVRMDEARYRAYWTVRRHVGKGVPPPELAPDAAVIAFVSSTPGSIGYISAESVTEGLNVIARY